MALETFDRESPAIVMHEKDNVCTLIRPVQAGEELIIDVQGQPHTVLIRQDTPFGHKIAIRSIQAGEHIYKYGESIGMASVDIQAGEHVHVHNLEGIRGRGDRA
ncbi:UxaA family hydrolase [Brevibacillus migulae]|uniref:UxaA family hydrolase n=1 Tax=Brevibacillus migulae TaxID=1644114 RepID=UPI00106DD4B9|nr:UxaA family hydrolase [Brevibacillus migulae]